MALSLNERELPLNYGTAVAASRQISSGTLSFLEVCDGCICVLSCTCVLSCGESVYSVVTLGRE